MTKTSVDGGSWKACQMQPTACQMQLELGRLPLLGDSLMSEGTGIYDRIICGIPGFFLKQ